MSVHQSSFLEICPVNREAFYHVPRDNTTIVKYETYYRSLLAAKLMVSPTTHDTLAIFSMAPGVPPVGPTAMVAFAATGSHTRPSKYAQSFTKYPSLRTVAAVQLALPMRQIDTEKQVKRFTERSLVSVFTRVVGKVKATVQREPLSAPGGAIRL